MILALLLGCTPVPLPSSHAIAPADASDHDDPAGDTADDTAEDSGTEDVVPARWTFAVFMNGDNDLEAYVPHDLNELEQVGSTPGVNVVVQADRIPGYDDEDGDWTGTRRYLIKGDQNEEHVGSPMVQDMGELDMADPAVLSDFLVWADENYPADHMAVILWDHGDGWTLVGDDPPTSYGISDDETSGSWMSIAEGEVVEGLSAVVERRGEPLDLIGFDACNMASWEVGHALRDSARYLAASESTVGWSGIQYGPALALLRDDVQADGAALADNLAWYAADEGGEWTFSATDFSQMDALAARMDALAGYYLDDTTRLAAWQKARAGARSVDTTYASWYVDLADLAEAMARSDDADEAALGKSVSEALSGAVVSAYGNTPYAWAGGLTVFSVTTHSDYMDLYHEGAGASWAKATRWDDLLIALADSR